MITEWMLSNNFLDGLRMLSWTGQTQLWRTEGHGCQARFLRVGSTGVGPARMVSAS